jgi:hypothetical protein
MAAVALKKQVEQVTSTNTGAAEQKQTFHDVSFTLFPSQRITETVGLIYLQR